MPRPVLLDDELSSRPPTRTARRRRGLTALLVALTLYAAWTTVVMTSHGIDDVDARFTGPSMTPRSVQGQAAEAFALVTHPHLVMTITAVLALRSLHQRQRRLAGALAVAALGIPLWELQRELVARPRPESAFADSVSAGGPGYPAGHLVAATVLTWVLVTLANAQRRSRRSQWRGRVMGVFLVGCVGVDQWALGIQHGSDLVGGVLLGTTVATGALWVSGVDEITRAWRIRVLPEHSGRRAAVVYNPTKIPDLDLFRRRVAYAMARSGWDPPLWLETRRTDPGREMAHDAVSKGVDRVLIAGGDGTARAVCAALAGSGVPVALIPAGTGNLLGRNLRVPLDEDEALDVALNGVTRPVDMVRWTIRGDDQLYAVMAGVGLDAQIMRDVSPRLKQLAHGGAYVVAGVQQVRMPPFRATVTLDGQVVHDGDAVLTLVANVGRLQGGVSLLPAADASDGRLHVLVASGSGVRGLARLVAHAGRDGSDAPLRRLSGRSVHVELDRAVAYQLDGDAAGQTREFSAEICPAALHVMVPR
jgi:diacylglycerol kinase family enzyme/membrane-associated phospholipid phosphatase